VAKDEENHDKPERDLGPNTVVPTAKESPQKFVTKAPFPEWLTAPKKGSKFDDILKVFKHVQINIPFLDAIQQVPSYAKFLKDLVTIKRRTNVPRGLRCFECSGFGNIRADCGNLKQAKGKAYNATLSDESEEEEEETPGKDQNFLAFVAL
jgi:hypothetical protein